MLDITGKRSWFFIISGIVILIGIISLLTFGLKPGIDFSSGSMLTLRFEQGGIGEGELRSSLQRRIDRLGLGDFVRLVGPRDDVRRLYAAFDVFALPSLWEAGPYTVLEAMASRLTLVASKNGGASEIIAHGEDGLLIDPFDLEQIEATLVTVLTDEAARQGWGEAAYRKVEQHYTWQRVAERFHRLYEDVIGSRAQ